MTDLFAGSCLCGAVHFQIIGHFESFYLCHCTRCQKGTGSAHAANLFSTTASLTWIKGEDQTQRYIHEQTQHSRNFCSVCGSPVPYSESKTNLLVVPAGSLDTPVTKQPDAHICFKDRAKWDDKLDNIRTIDGLPS